jgi:hypothetical protein
MQDRRMSKLRFTAGIAAVTLLSTTASAAPPVVVPFDFARHTISLTVKVHGTPLLMFLDTGVDPSAIDTARARALGLKIDFTGGGEASGAGDAQHVMVYPTAITGLTVGGHAFPPVVALAADYKDISNAYGRQVDGTLGHSFLTGRAVLFDYPARTVAIADSEAELAPQIRACSRAWRMKLRSFKGDTIPIVDMGIGGAHLPASIDTGSNGTVELFQRALDQPAIKAALVQAGTTKNTGARGVYTVKVYRLNAPISLGPFVLPPGQSVMLKSDAGSADTRLANVGNKLLASMGVKMLVDYRGNQIAFLGCTR